MLNLFVSVIPFRWDGQCAERKRCLCRKNRLDEPCSDRPISGRALRACCETGGPAGTRCRRHCSSLNNQIEKKKKFNKRVLFLFIQRVSDSSSPPLAVIQFDKSTRIPPYWKRPSFRCCMLDEIFFLWTSSYQQSPPPLSSACLNLDLPYLFFSILFYFAFDFNRFWMCHIEWENICGEELEGV